MPRRSPVPEAVLTGGARRDEGDRQPAASGPPQPEGWSVMAESVYRVTELVGTSSESWERAAAVAVETASQTLRDLRIAEVVELDMQIEDGQVRAYRARVKVSFKYSRGDAS
jgi:flavin-binding protein dodecin